MPAKGLTPWHLVLITGLCLPGMALADTQDAEDDVLPDGFLEFLGMMVEHDGELIDPLSLGGRMSPDDNESREANSEDIEVQQSRNRERAAAQEYPDEN